MDKLPVFVDEEKLVVVPALRQDVLEDALQDLHLSALPTCGSWSVPSLARRKMLSPRFTYMKSCMLKFHAGVGCGGKRGHSAAARVLGKPRPRLRCQYVRMSSSSFAVLRTTYINLKL